jgi:hypothetical protein
MSRWITISVFSATCARDRHVVHEQLTRSRATNVAVLVQDSYTRLVREPQARQP